MKLKEQVKKLGFSLMEIVLAIAIVGILLLITIPVINRQLDKADEYSYYLAYKTVEKLGGQIVALGDEEETTAMLPSDIKLANEHKSFGQYLADKSDSIKNNVRIYFANLGQKFAYSEHYIFNRLFAKAFAESYTVVESSLVTSSSYDDLWLHVRVCSGASVIKNKTYKTIEHKDEEGNVTSTEKVEGDPVYFTQAELDCDTFRSVQDNEIKLTLFSSNFCKNASVSSAKSSILGQAEPSFSNFCSGFMSSNCKNRPDSTYGSVTVNFHNDGGSGSADEGEEGEDPDEVLDGETSGVEGAVMHESDPSGYCQMQATKTITYDPSSADPPAPKVKYFYDQDCIDRGYINFRNEGGNPGTYLDCIPKPGYVVSANDERAAVSPCDKGVTTYASVNSTRTSASKACCATDFNEMKGTCCPDHSNYSGSGECQCIEGYEMKNNKCIRSKCSAGSTLVDGVCVANASLLKASRFCKKITEHWNTSESSCSGFSTQDGVEYNSAVYNAATGNDSEYLSINSKPEAFKNIKPNIEFSNGLRLWILNGKSASIPGLSSTPSNASAVQNGCNNIKLTTPSAAACAKQNGYYCNNENRCYSIADKDNATVADARNCCATVDLTDYAEAAMDAGTPDDYKKVSVSYAVSGFTVFVDINGDKGNGTLWDDVFPFYVGSNGTVYPAYPLNAAERASDGSELHTRYIGGNSEKQLPVDVYYYEARGNQREKVVVFPNVSYARGICSARKLSKYTPYCLNLGEKFYNKVSATDTLEGTSYIGNDGTTSKNPCDSRPCFISVRRKLSTF